MKLRATLVFVARGQPGGRTERKNAQHRGGLFGGTENAVHHYFGAHVRLLPATARNILRLVGLQMVSDACSETRSNILLTDI
jgi:hypothetical protein